MNIVERKGDISELKKKIKYIYIITILAFLVLISKIFYLQIIKGNHYNKLGQNNIVRNEELPTVRGTIKDSEGRIIATNRPSYNVYLTPYFFAIAKLPAIAEYLDLSPQEQQHLREQIQSSQDLERFKPILIKEDIDEDTLAVLETHHLDLPGVRVRVVPVRFYPYGELASHLVGYVGEISNEELQNLSEKDYEVGDSLGKSGIENAFEDELRGIPGWQKEIVDARGIERNDIDINDLISGPLRQEPIPGHDIELTIDIELQRIVSQELRGHLSAGVVIVDVNTGRILAISSKPGFDPNEFSNGLDNATMQDILSNPFHPLFDKTIQGLYSPGSTFKIITALAALQEGIITPQDRFTCSGSYELGGTRFRCSQSHGEVDLYHAITESCNVYFYRLAELTGIDRISHYAMEFGFGDPTGININYETAGRVTTREWYEQRGIHFHNGHTLNTAIGQGNIQVNLIQLVMAYAAVANGGILYYPQIVNRIEDPEGHDIRDIEPRVRRRLSISPEFLSILTDALIGVVHSPLGTASESNEIIGDITVAGKTGTAEVPRRPVGDGENEVRSWYFNRDHAWFAGFAPAHDPQIAIVVLIEHGGTGGRNAAPVALSILRRYFDEIAPQQQPDIQPQIIAERRDNNTNNTKRRSTASAGHH